MKIPQIEREFVKDQHEKVGPTGKFQLGPVDSNVAKAQEKLEKRNQSHIDFLENRSSTSQYQETTTTDHGEDNMDSDTMDNDTDSSSDDKDENFKSVKCDRNLKKTTFNTHSLPPLAR